MEKVSVVIVNWNTGDLIRRCVQTLRKCTSYPYELILVDNGSTDGSADIVRSLEKDDTKIVLLDKNYGFAGGNNRGLEVATGDVICLLNSDAFVTKGWLQSLVRCMSRTGAGMVGPWTNKAKGAQRHKAKYRMIPKVFRRSKHVHYLSFFCVLINRSVVERVGCLDESFGLGTFEDDDFCRRALSAGFDLVIDGKSWVWHEAHATMKANKISELDLLDKNREVYSNKWSGDNSEN